MINNTVPPRLALSETTRLALESIKWLKEIKDSNQKRILTDIISVYVSVLAEKGGSGYSLPKFYGEAEPIKKFLNLDIVKKCSLNRNNRCGHQSKNYGMYVMPDEILNSDLEKWLEDIKLIIHLTKDN
jgi:hypothetical protein